MPSRDKCTAPVVQCSNCWCNNDTSNFVPTLVSICYILMKNYSSYNFLFFLMQECNWHIRWWHHGLSLLALVITSTATIGNREEIDFVLVHAFVNASKAKFLFSSLFEADFNISLFVDFLSFSLLIISASVNLGFYLEISVPTRDSFLFSCWLKRFNLWLISWGQNNRSGTKDLSDAWHIHKRKKLTSSQNWNVFLHFFLFTIMINRLTMTLFNY